MTAKIQDSEVAIFHSELAMVRWLMSGQTMDRTAFPVPAPETCRCGSQQFASAAAV